MESFDTFCPSTNNALERFNLTIKSKYVQWNRYSVIDFIKIIEKIILDAESGISEANFTEIIYESSIYQVSQLFDFVEIESDAEYSMFVATTKVLDSCELAIIKLYISKGYNWPSIKNMKNFLDQYPIIKSKNEVLSYKDLSCSCLYFVKKKQCIHAFLFIKYKNKAAIINTNLLSLKMKRGRPKTIKKNNSLNLSI